MRCYKKNFRNILMIKVKNKLVRDNGLNQRFISIGIIEKAK